MVIERSGPFIAVVNLPTYFVEILGINISVISSPSHCSHSIRGIIPPRVGQVGSLFLFCPYFLFSSLCLRIVFIFVSTCESIILIVFYLIARYVSTIIECFGECAMCMQFQVWVHIHTQVNLQHKSFMLCKYWSDNRFCIQLPK